MRQRARRWVGLTASASVAVAGLAGCASPSPEGLSPDQCAQFLPLTEEYLFLYLEDDWQLVAENPASAVAAVDRVIGNLDEAIDQLSTPATEAAVQRVRDEYTDVRRLLAEYATDEPFTRDPADVAGRDELLDAVAASLSDCGDINRAWPSPLPTDAE